MRLFKITGLSHLYVEKEIFNNADIMVCDGEKIGLVGPNGCGKSTFLKILTGEIAPDSIFIEKNKNLKIGFLDQFAGIYSDTDVYGYLDSVFEELHMINSEIEHIYENIQYEDERAQEKSLIKAQELLDHLDKMEYGRINKKIVGVLTGLGFNEADHYKKTSELSGGMKTKLKLARLLLQDNDILVLDEPTNFLDIDYSSWLAEFLPRQKYAYIIISHDESFLQKTCSRIIEIANRRFRNYNGDYKFYLEEKIEKDAAQLHQFNEQQKYIANAEIYIENNSEEAMRGIVRTKATWLKKMLETMERIERPEEVLKPRFSFAFLKGASSNIISVNSAVIGYNNIPLAPAMNLRVSRGEKIIIKGYNGIGKTTLLKTIYGDIDTVSGEIVYGNNLKAVFLRQEEDYENNFSSFNSFERRSLGIKKKQQREITVIEFIKEYFPDKSSRELHKLLFSCGLDKRHLFERVRSLSGGEMTKLRLCTAMMNEVNVIILDEPTNHLDKYSKEVLMHALEIFEGTVLMTTHDINADISWATLVVNLEDMFEK